MNNSWEARLSGRIVALALALAGTGGAGARAGGEGGLFSKDNLVAWCIVPFDAKNRGPRERAEMLHRLGLRKFAYDWRDKHVPSFEEEILALKERNIEFFAFWGAHEGMFKLFEKHGLSPQIWQTAPSPGGETPEKRVEAAARQLLPLVERTRRLGCRLGLYNHGGWGGEPENLAAVCSWLREREKAAHVGIVYNLHHGHGHIDGFKASLEKMKPFLLCLNLNGMNTGAKPKILPVGQGQHDTALMKIVRESGYRGPIGILGHREELDAEESLRLNIDGLKKVLREMGDEAALRTYR